MHEIVVAVLGITVLLALVSLLLPVANRLNVPYTVLLAAVGGILGSIVFVTGRSDLPGVAGDLLVALASFEITADAVFFIFLPTLIFEAALSINVHRVLDDIAPILVLAIAGLLISTFAIGYTLWAASGFALVTCLLLGSIVSATDPVAVVALFRDLGAPKRLAILVEGESLFNDATAIVLFSILAAMLLGGAEADLLDGADRFVVVFLGGVVVGFISARGLCLLLGRMRQVPLVKITLTVALAYLVFLVAEHYLHVSGVMAVVTAALVVGSYGRTKISPRTWDMLAETWEQLAFWANSLIFVLVGLTVPSLLLASPALSFDHIGLLALLVVAALAARAAILFGLLPTLNVLGVAARVTPGYSTVMLWGGLHGAVSLALALVVLETPGFDAETKRFVVVLVTGFVLFTLFVNATTMRPLLQLLGLAMLPPAERAVRNRAMALSLAHIRQAIDQVAQDHHVERPLVRDIAEAYDRRLAEIDANMDEVEGLSHEDRVRIGLEALVNRERHLYLDYFAEHLVSAGIAGQVLAESERILDGVKADGTDGYQAAVTRALDFSLGFRAALALHRWLGLNTPLASRLADRFEVVLAKTSVLRELGVYCDTTLRPLLGDVTCQEVRSLLTARQQETETAQEALGLQYPDYAKSLKQRFLGRLALRLEEADYQRMLDESALSQEVFNDLLQSLQARSDQLERRPRLNLGLEPAGLVAKVPFFADLSAVRIGEVAKLLKPRLVLPGERVVGKGEVGDAMYFIDSGAVEVGVTPTPVRLGSGDFFGEIALLKQVHRTADVTALCYYRCLALYVKDFQELLDAQPELRRTITAVAEERLASLAGRDQQRDDQDKRAP